MSLLLIIALVLLLWYYVLPYLIRRRFQRTFGFDPRDPNRQRRQQQPKPEPPVKKKKIDPTVGEYVEFTETVETTTRVTPEGEGTTVKTEQQITDIQWEDLPNNPE